MLQGASGAREQLRIGVLGHLERCGARSQSGVFRHMFLCRRACAWHQAAALGVSVFVQCCCVVLLRWMEPKATVPEVFSRLNNASPKTPSHKPSDDPST